MIDFQQLCDEIGALPDEARERLPLAELSGRTLFLSGATGFVGTWLLAAIAWMNERVEHPVVVRALTRSPQSAGPAWLTWVMGDACGFQDPVPCDFVIHAALPSTPTPSGGVRELFASAFEGTRSTLNHAVASGARRFLLLSSGAVYGAPAAASLTEEAFSGTDPFVRCDAYAEAKRASESYASAFSVDTGLDIAVARLFTCLGPGYRGHGHLAHVSLLDDALAGRPIALRGDGSAVRSYLYGADLAVWLLRLLVSGKPGEAVNIGSDAAMTVLDFARLVARVAGRGEDAVVTNRVDAEPPKRPVYVPDITRARARLGVAPWTSPDKAVHRTLTCLASAIFESARPTGPGESA